MCESGWCEPVSYRFLVSGPREEPEERKRKETAVTDSPEETLAPAALAAVHGAPESSMALRARSRSAGSVKAAPADCRRTHHLGSPKTTA